MSIPTARVGPPSPLPSPHIPGVPSLPTQPVHSPDYAWRWPHRSAAQPRRPWLSPAAHAPCSCTWPARDTRRRHIRAGGQAGGDTPHLQLESNVSVGTTQPFTQPSLSTCCRAQQKGKSYSPDLQSSIFSIKCSQIPPNRPLRFIPGTDGKTGPVPSQVGHSTA